MGKAKNCHRGRDTCRDFRPKEKRFDVENLRLCRYNGDYSNAFCYKSNQKRREE